MQLKTVLRHVCVLQLRNQSINQINQIKYCVKLTCPTIINQDSAKQMSAAAEKLKYLCQANVPSCTSVLQLTSRTTCIKLACPVTIITDLF